MRRILFAFTVLLCAGHLGFSQNTTWILNGNTVATDAKLGTNNEKNIIIETNNIERLRVLYDGKIGMGTVDPESKLHVVGDFTLDGGLKFPEWALMNDSTMRLLQLGSNGDVRMLSVEKFVDELYARDCIYFSNTYKPTWGAYNNGSRGVIFTGYSCSAWVGIGTQEPMSSLDVRGGTVTETVAVGSYFQQQPDLLNRSALFVDCQNASMDGVIIRSHPSNVNIPFRLSRNPNVNEEDLFKVRSDGTAELLHYGPSTEIAFVCRNQEVNGQRQDVALLTADGNWHCQGLHIKYAPFWPDYVFEKNYSLMPLNEVELYIQKHHHLPDMPSAEQVKQKGVDVYETVNVLTKKVEELTLYIIAQHKEIEALKNQKH